MLARTHRFHGHGSLRYVYSNGQVVRSQLGILKYAPNERRNTWRAAVVVSRKVHKSAVMRNRIRRRVYEIIRIYMQKTELPMDIVFVVYSEQIASMPTDDLSSAITDMLKKTGIVNNKEL